MYDIREIPLSSRWFTDRVEKFLLDNGLLLDSRLDYLVGVYDFDDNLVGCGGLDGATIKCIALAHETRGHNIASQLVSHLYSRAREQGAENVTLFTKPDNEKIFSTLGFHIVGRASRAIMMETSPTSLSGWLSQLSALPQGERNGVIVMNANPATKGHRYLIKEAAKQVDRLTVIPVADEKSSMFSYNDRRSILEDICSQYDNVTVAPGSIYAISAATFPSYFLKKADDVATSHMALDLDIFIRHIAPALKATVRFAGTEPRDLMTCNYNQQMSSLLRDAGMDFIVIPRLCIDDMPVSASDLRSLLMQNRVFDALRLADICSVPTILEKVATSALITELELTPKPGLVDLHDTGSHTDMDAKLMRKGIEAIRPCFKKMARQGLSLNDELNQYVASLVKLGQQAERDMLEATNGVNTHRGAIFSMGLAIASTARLLAEGKPLTADNLSQQIAQTAQAISPARGTHGADVRVRYNAGGALASAQDGYSEMFSSWIPQYREFQSATETFAGEHLIRLLLNIILTLQDSNALYRAGKDGAFRAQQLAAEALQNLTLSALARLNDEFVKLGISHGGAADMLSLTIFCNSVTSTKSVSNKKC
ncbi:MAG: GNAT family N-acetyltransferase [Muribaculaceae bacterium]|nr:GNAT family N-acetyltransferase [Muribaculaceae bacterium]